MVQVQSQPAAEPTPSGVRRGQSPMAMCPMATMCAGMTKKRPSRLLLMLPGALLIVVGMLIFFEPRILVWLMGSVSILFGMMLLMMANVIRRFSAHMRNM